MGRIYYHDASQWCGTFPLLCNYFIDSMLLMSAFCVVMLLTESFSDWWKPCWMERWWMMIHGSILLYDNKNEKLNEIIQIG